MVGIWSGMLGEEQKIMLLYVEKTQELYTVQRTRYMPPRDESQILRYSQRLESPVQRLECSHILQEENETEHDTGQTDGHAGNLLSTRRSTLVVRGRSRRR
jgi:hypothetical protein